MGNLPIYPNNESPQMNTDGRTASVSRLMQVPARFIFAAHAHPQHLMRWFGPVGYPVTLCEIDFRVGGRWRMAMTGPDGVQGPPFGGTYLEIVPDMRIVYDNAFEDDGQSMALQNAGTMIMTTTLAEGDGATTITVTMLFATAEMKAEYLGVGMTEGILSGLDQLEDVARELQG
jgi:uncharacterized protein YndB with AHSA1/START domain